MTKQLLIKDPDLKYLICTILKMMILTRGLK